MHRYCTSHNTNTTSEHFDKQCLICTYWKRVVQDPFEINTSEIWCQFSQFQHSGKFSGVNLLFIRHRSQTDPLRFHFTTQNSDKMGEQLKLRGVLSGHGNWVTAIATTQEDPTLVLTASRDKVNILSICESYVAIIWSHLVSSLPM